MYFLCRLSSRIDDRHSFAAGRRLPVAAIVVALPLLTCGCHRPEDVGPTASIDAANRIHQALLAGSEGGGGGGAAVATGTGWATIKGRFTYEGSPPAMPRYDVKSDLATCAPGGQAPRQEYLLVDNGTKGIANIAIFPRKVSRVHESATPESEPLEFDQKSCVFLTHVLGFTVNQPITILNSDPVGHNTKVSGKNQFNQTIASGAEVEYVARRAEALPARVQCSIHPWMLAYFLPRDDQYLAITAEDGSFEIANLPAGEVLEFQLWHESSAGANGALEIQSSQTEGVDWRSKGRFRVKLEENDTKELIISVPASAFAAG